MDRNQRRKCINYKIRCLPFRPKDSAEVGAERRILKVCAEDAGEIYLI
jgi:hypothetical protein